MRNVMRANGDGRLGFVSHFFILNNGALILNDLQMLDGSVIDAGESGLVAKDELEALAVVGQVTERPGEAAIGAGVREFRRHAMGVFEHVVPEDVGFHDGKPGKTPAGGG